MSKKRNFLASLVIVLSAIAPIMYNGSACFFSWGEPHVPDSVSNK